MPRSKDPRSYSRELGTVLQKAYLEGEVRLPPMPISLARSRRSEFYSYIQAVRRYPEHAQASVEASWQVSFRLEGEFDGTGSCTLVLYNKENTPTAVFLREALNLPKQSEQAKASEQTLMRKLAGELEPAPLAKDPMEQAFDYGAPAAQESTPIPPAQPRQSAIQAYLNKKKEQ